MIVKGWTSDSLWPQLVYAGQHDLPDGRIVVVTAWMSRSDRDVRFADWIAAQLPRWLVETDSLAELWNLLNQAIRAEKLHGSFVACTVASYDPHRRELECARFGSPDLILVRNAGALSRTSEPRFPALGILDDIDMTESYEAAPIRVQSGDMLVCQEGVTEIWNADGAEYGEERLRQVVARAASESPDAAAIAAAVVNDCEERCGHDWSEWPAALMVAVF